VGIVKANGEWVLEMSSNNIFAEAIKSEEGQTALTGQKTYLSYEYLGGGIFISTLGVELMEPGAEFSRSIGSFTKAGSYGHTCYFYNTENKKSWKFSAHYITPYEYEHMLAADSGNYFIVDKKGEVRDSGIPYSQQSILSNGVFLSNGLFYSINGVLVLDIREYDLINPWTVYFKDGYCDISFKNPSGSVYYATIDINGKFVREPSKDETIFEKPIKQNSKSDFKLIKENTLTVAVDTNTSSSFIYEENGKFTGFEIEIIEYIASELGLKIEYLKIDWNKQLIAISTNKADVAIGVDFEGAIVGSEDYPNEGVDFTNSYFRIPVRTMQFLWTIAVGENKNLLSNINATVKKLVDCGKMDDLMEKYNIEKYMEETAQRVENVYF